MGFKEDRTENSRDDWETPDNLFANLNTAFKFKVDVCANEKNQVEKLLQRDRTGWSRIGANTVGQHGAIHHTARPRNGYRRHSGRRTIMV